MTTEGKTTSAAHMIDRRRRPRQRTCWKPSRTDVLIVVVLAAIVLLAGLVALRGHAYATTVTFTADSLLGKPTNNSITINIVPAATIQYYYGTGPADGGPYAGQSSPSMPPAGSRAN